MAEYTRDNIEFAIELRFDSKKECARALGITESTLSRNLKKLSNAFIQRLRGVGVNVEVKLVKYNAPERPTFVTGDKRITYQGLSFVEQIAVLNDLNLELKKNNAVLETEISELKKQLIKLRDDCGKKEGCQIKKLKIEIEDDGSKQE